MRMGQQCKWSQTGECDTGRCDEIGFCAHAPRSERFPKLPEGISDAEAAAMRAVIKVLEDEKAARSPASGEGK
jgi:hypothetical protein